MFSSTTTSKQAPRPKTLTEPVFSEQTSKRATAATANQAPMTAGGFSYGATDHIDPAESSVHEMAKTQTEINAALDPIRALKSLFLKPATTRRTVHDVNLVIHKYKEKQKSRGINRNSRQIGARPYFSQQAGRALVPDDMESARFVEPEIEATDRVPKTQHASTRFNGRFKAFKEDMEQTQPVSRLREVFETTNKKATAAGSSAVSESHTLKDLNIRERLDNLKRLFDEDEENEQVR